MKVKPFDPYVAIGVLAFGALIPAPWSILPVCTAAAGLMYQLKFYRDRADARYEELKAELEELRASTSPPELREASDSDIYAMERTIEQAIYDKSDIHFGYQDKEGAVTERRVTPWSILNYDSGPVLNGFCHLRDEERNFKLARMQSLVALESEEPTNSVFASSGRSSLDDVPF